MVEDDPIEQWVRAAQAGDRLALAKLLTAFHPQLLAVAQARMDAALKARRSPDDILQEVYLDVAQQVERFDDRGPGSFQKWLCAILEHKLIDAGRAVRCQMRDVRREAPAGAATLDSYWNLLDNICADSGTPSRAVRREEALDALLACIDELSDAHRQIVQLRFLDGLSVEQVAARLGKTPAAVVAMTRRALEALRVSMNRLGEFTRGA